jgi:hypothetical protein
MRARRRLSGVSALIAVALAAGALASVTTS